MREPHGDMAATRQEKGEDKMTSYKSNMGAPHPIDKHVGNKIKTARKLRKMTQTDLAVAIGISYQQIQKYEKGDNRVSASMMYGIAQAINIPVAYFYEGLDPGSNLAEFTFSGKELSLIRAIRNLGPGKMQAIRSVVRSMGVV